MADGVVSSGAAAQNGASNGKAKTNGYKPMARESSRRVKRADVENTFGKYAQLIHAARRPLPTKTGDGTYVKKKEQTGLLTDLGAMGIKGIRTLFAVKKQKRSGELVDDRTYLMERIIQVRE
jgi:linoleate 10R-lipoxygenase